MNLTSNEENVVKLGLSWLSCLIIHFYFSPDCFSLRLVFRNKAGVEVTIVTYTRDSICDISRPAPLSWKRRKVHMCEPKEEQRFKVPLFNNAGCFSSLQLANKRQSSVLCYFWLSLVKWRDCSVVLRFTFASSFLLLTPVNSECLLKVLHDFLTEFEMVADYFWILKLHWLLAAHICSREQQLANLWICFGL